jgi:hypothetical protein
MQEYGKLPALVHRKDDADADLAHVKNIPQ